MKSKALIAVAVASTLGWSANAFAGSGHEVISPSAVNESSPTGVQEQHDSIASSSNMDAVGSVSDEAGGSVSGAFDQSASASSTNESSASGMDDTLARADQGIYSEYYLVSWTPSEVDYYLIDVNQPLLISETFIVQPYELALIQSSSDENVYEVAFVPTTSEELSLESSGETADG